MTDHKHHSCQCAIIRLDKGDRVLNVPHEHYTTFWNKLSNNKKAPDIRVEGEKKQLHYDKDTNTIFFFDEIKEDSHIARIVRHYLTPTSSYSYSIL
jgi:hypothetical protein